MINSYCNSHEIETCIDSHCNPNLDSLEYTPSVLVPTINLNPQQQKASDLIKKYINYTPDLPPDDMDNVSFDDPNELFSFSISLDDKFTPEQSNKHNFLLLGPGGSGKTTTIINAFHGTPLRVAFCAFTNKATQVLKGIAEKFNIQFQATFMTIHKLLALEPRYFERETELAFDFSTDKIEHLHNFDVIIMDECSTISKELYNYLIRAWEFIYFKHKHSIKFIYLGDYWQLPPVGETRSLVFQAAQENKWSIVKLNKVMRSKNTTMANINSNLLSWIDRIRKGQLSDFHLKYPYNLVNDDLYTDSLYEFYSYYIDCLSNSPDVVILTYSRSNANKTNAAIQDILDEKEGRPLRGPQESLLFHQGDRCCMDRPIQLCEITHAIDGDSAFVRLGQPTDNYLYNGEIFEVTQVYSTKVKTLLNTFKYIDKYFNAQLITVRRIDTKEEYDIIHIDEEIINNARRLIRGKERRAMYLNIMTNYIRHYPKLDYGYCMTIYKSQGSEWTNVLINMKSIHACLAQQPTIEKKKMLFKTTYTALTRASANLKLFWF